MIPSRSLRGREEFMALVCDPFVDQAKIDVVQHGHRLGALCIVGISASRYL